MSRWVVVGENDLDLHWLLRCPTCSNEQTESSERLDRLGWPMSVLSDPREEKPVLRCRVCGYEPHLPGPSDLVLDRIAI